MCLGSMTMKKIGIILCLSSVLFAVPSAQAAWEENWLVGVTGGYANRDGNLNVNHGSPAPGRQVAIINQALDESGFMWGLLVGYQARCNGWLFGGELNIDWRNLNENQAFAFTDGLSQGWNATASYNQDTVVGLTGRFGYEVTPCFMPYVRFGAETGDDSLNYRAATVSGTAIAASVDGSRRQYRFVGGIGAEMPIPMLACLSFRLEYNFYSKGKGVDASGFASDNLTFVNANGRVKTSAGKAALVYNFF